MCGNRVSVIFPFLRKSCTDPISRSASFLAGNIVIFDVRQKLVFPVVALTLLGACRSIEPGLASSPDVAKSAVTVTANDTGHIIDLARGQELIVRLASNRTTGYGWTLADSAERVLAPQGEPEYVRDPTRFNEVGVGGTEVWRLKATRAGQQTLRFHYRRPWELGVEPVRTATYLVNVR